MENNLPPSIDNPHFEPEEFNQEFVAGSNAPSADMVISGRLVNFDELECTPQHHDFFHPVAFNNVPMTEAEGFMVIFGKSGTGKSSILYSLFAACNGMDEMGWSTKFNPSEDVFLYFDTEESQNGIEKRMHDAIGTKKPAWFRFWSLMKYAPSERMQFIEGVVHAIKTNQGKRVWLAINQLQDLSNSGMNNEDESKVVVDWLMRQDYFFSVVVLQENVSEGSEGRPSGMLGRSVIQKAEGSLQTQKSNEDKQTVRTAHKVRYQKGKRVCIEFEGLVARKIGDSITPHEEKERKKMEVLRLAFDKHDSDHFSTQNEIADAIAAITHKTARNAIDTYIKPLLAKGFIIKDSEGIKLADEEMKL